MYNIVKGVDKMAVPKKQQACVTRYVASHYDQIKLTVPKGSRDRYKAAAASLGVSVNQLFINAVEQFIADNVDKLTEDGEQSS